MKTGLSFLFIALIFLTNCSDEPEKGPLEGFYKGIMFAEQDVIEIVNLSDTLFYQRWRQENYTLSIRTDKYYTRNMNGDYFIVNDSSISFALVNNNCFFFECEAILNGNLKYHWNDPYTLVMEDVIDRLEFGDFGQTLFISEKRRFTLAIQ